MKISDLLRDKGSAVATVSPTTSVTELLRVLSEYNIGATVVTEADNVVGIVSERDIVRRLHERGADLLSAPVGEIMTRNVVTCTPADSVDSLASTMTERRIRHMPVVSDGQLVGIVSIGDVVKRRLDEIEQESLILRDAYIASH